MTYDEIMTKITSGLSGDNKRDINYLHEQMETYKDHELSKEIIRACGRLLYDLLPEEARTDIGKLIEKDNLGVTSTIQEAQFNVFQKNYDVAEKLMSDLISRFEKAKLFQNDSVSEYHTFANVIQELLYRTYQKEKIDIRRATEPFSEMYLVYGSLMVEVGRLEDAKAALEKALRWNPADVRILFEYAETFKMEGDFDKFLDVTKEAWKYAYEKSSVARCCRNAGFYFSEKEMWSEAAGYLLASLQYDRQSLNAQSELYYIHGKAGESFVEPSLQEAQEIAAKYNMPIGPDADLVAILYIHGKHFHDVGMNDISEQLLKAVYDLAPIKEIGDLLQEIKEAKDVS